VDPEFLDEEDSLKAVEGVSAGNEPAKKKIKKKRYSQSYTLNLKL
jgi:hypothetical protein